MLAIEELHKTYSGGARGDTHALRGVTLKLEPGIFGLLGPNGAGKSTLMKILATLLQPDGGSVWLDDSDLLLQPKTARRMLGYLPQNFGLYPTFTARQILDYFARLKGIQKTADRARIVDDLLDRVNLTAQRDHRVGSFSGGMLQRIGIAQAMIASPRLIIVDEPTAGLDPEERSRFHNLLADVAYNDTVVILSTHLVSEVAGVCGRIGVMLDGALVAACTPDDAVAQLRGKVWEATVMRDDAQRARATMTVLSTQVVPGGVRMRVLRDMDRAGSDNAPLTPATPTLDDFYMSLMVSRS